MLRAATTASAAVGATQLTLEFVDNWLVGSSVIQNTPTGAIAYGTTITAINTSTNTITLSQPLRATLASGQVVKSWTEGGYGGLARWVFTRTNSKTARPDDELYGEPRAFRATFEEMLCEAGIPVYYSGGCVCRHQIRRDHCKLHHQCACERQPAMCGEDGRGICHHRRGL